MVVEIYAGLTCQYPHISSLGVGGGVEYHMRGVFLESFPPQLISRELFARGVRIMRGTNYAAEMNVFTCKLPNNRGQGLIYGGGEDKLCSM